MKETPAVVPKKSMFAAHIVGDVPDDMILPTDETPQGKGLSKWEEFQKRKTMLAGNESIRESDESQLVSESLDTMSAGNLALLSDNQNEEIKVPDRMTPQNSEFIQIPIANSVDVF